MSDPTLAETVRHHLSEVCADLLTLDDRLRQHVAVDDVHHARVAARRLRSWLRLLRDLVEPDTTEVEADLRWYAGLLGDIRDRDVLVAYLDGEVAALSDRDVLGPVAAELNRSLAAARRGAVETWQTESQTPRHAQLTELVERWRSEPPVRDDSGLDARRLVKKAQRAVERRFAAAGTDPERWHEVRKATKRLRYTTELTDGLVPKSTRIAKRARKLQQQLGAHQDRVLAIDFLRAHAAEVGLRRRHNGYTYGVLAARAVQQTEDIRQHVARHARI